MAEAPCPGGSQPKPPFLHEQIWATLEEVCERINWLVTLLNINCAMLVPRRMDFDEMCASPPPELPELDWAAITRGGPSFTNLGTFVDWMYTAWQQTMWNTYCECRPIGGIGPCAPLDTYNGTHTGTWTGGLTLMARRPVDRLGFTRATVIRTRGSDGPAGRYYFSYQLENASQVVVGSTATALAQTLYPGGTRSDPDSISTQALRDTVRFISFWGRPSGVDGQTTTATYSASATFDVTFTGNCDTTVTPPPPELPEPPEQPDVPPMPPLPASCTTDTLCAMLWVVLQELHSVQQLAAVVQRYQLPFRYVLGEPIGPLTGSGSLEIAALVGIRADVTSAAPPRVLEGNPPYWWDQGWMSVLTPEGMIEEKRITRDAQVWQPRLIQEATTFGYYLKEGVSATFTPLYPEPY